MKKNQKQRLSLQSRRPPYAINIQTDFIKSNYKFTRNNPLNNTNDQTANSIQSKTIKCLYQKKINKTNPFRKIDDTEQTNIGKQTSIQIPKKNNLKQQLYDVSNEMVGFPQLRTSKKKDSEMHYAPFLQMKINHFGKSEKILKNSQKNSQILNEIIEILKTEPNPNSQIRAEKRFSLKGRKNRQRQSKLMNQFDIEEIKFEKSSKGPKISNNQFLKLFSHNNTTKANRRIYSEERSRGIYLQRQNNLSNLKGKRKEEDEAFQKPHKNLTQTNQIDILTFYKPKYTNSNPFYESDFNKNADAN